MLDQVTNVSLDDKDSGDSDAQEKEQRQGQRAKAYHFGIRARLYLAFGSVVALTLLAGGSAWYSFGTVQDSFDQAAQISVPAMAEAFRIKADAAALNAAAPRLANASSAQQRGALEVALNEDVLLLRGRLEALEKLGADPDSLAAIGKEVEGINRAMSGLNQQVATRLELAGLRNGLISDVEQTQSDVDQKLLPQVAMAQKLLLDQTASTAKNTSASINTLMGEDVAVLRTSLEAQVIFSGMMIYVAEGVAGSRSDDIEQAEKNTRAVLEKLEVKLKEMPEAALEVIQPIYDELQQIILGKENVFALRTTYLGTFGAEKYDSLNKLGEKHARLLALRQQLADSLNAEVNMANDQVVFGSMNVTKDSEEAINSLVQRGVGRVTKMLQAQAEVNYMAGLLIQAATTDSLANVKPLRTQFNAAEGRLAEIMTSLPITDEMDVLRETVNGLVAYGKGFDSAFTVRKQELEAIAYSEEALSLARASASQLNVQVDQLIAQAEAQLSGATQDVSGAIDDSKTAIALIVLASVVIGLLIAWLYVGRNLVARLSRLSRSMGEISSGDLSAAVPEGGSDEITDMGHALAIFRDSLSAAEVERRENEAQREAASQQRRVEMLALADNFDASVKGVVESVSSSATQMQATAGSMSTTADQTNQQAGVVASAADVTTGDVQMAAAAAQELSNSIDEIGRQVNRSNEIATEASTRAQQTNQEIEGLAVAANKIGEVVNLIQEIAEQTNLLALNATIEAARAGDAGKGFAVVASEVKSLANQTAKATEEIGSQIGGMQTATGEAVTAIKTIGRVIEQMNEISTSISAAVEEQGAATQEIASTMQRVSEGTQSVSTNISGVSRAAGETGQSANEVLAAADEVARQSETLRGQVEGFLAKIRAA
jgi:methyl-accepting chemotaxis protein